MGTFSEKGYVKGNHVELIRGGSDFFKLLSESIRSARYSVHLQVYIMEADATGNQVADALADAARKNLDVRLLLDGYASRGLPDFFLDRLRKAGVKVKFFEPLFRSNSFYFGRRLHHKLFVADDAVALVGGINISDRYNDINGHMAWLDFALFVKGPVCGELSVLAWKTWNGFSRPSAFYVPRQVENTEGRKLPVRTRRNDWVRRKNQISGSYINMFLNANEEITILCSYFIPGRVIRKHLSKAVKRGVKVKLILAGMSDVAVAKNAERFMYDWLLRKKIEIYEYHASVLHGKMAVCDNILFTVGSYNINDISAYASIELNLDVHDASFASQAGDLLRTIMNDHCHKVEAEGPRYIKGWWKQFKCWVSYRVFRMMLYVFTFYFKKQQ